MTASLWLPPLVKALSTALLVVSASVAADALGPFWGALIASLPVSAGPAYVFLAMQHGDGFVADSALSSFAANASTGLFLVAYGRLAARTPPWRCLAIAVLLWLAAAFVTHQVKWTPSTALLLNCVVYGVGFALLQGLPSGAATIQSRASRRRWLDLGARAVAVAAFVTAVIATSSLLGPEATGIAAVTPVSLISLIVIVRPRIGGAASALLAAGALRAMFGFGLMLMVLHLTARPWGATVALSVALLVSAVWSAGLLILRPRRRSG